MTSTIHRSCYTLVSHSGMVFAWRESEILGFDLETTGVDRFSDVPVSFALVTFAAGRVVGARSRLIDPGREIPAEALAVHGISTARARAEGVPLRRAVEQIAAVLVAASARGVPVAGMKLDFDLTIVDAQCRVLDGRGLQERGWRGPVLDAVVIDRRFDRFRSGRRTLVDLCDHYGVSIEAPHEASADARAAVGVLRAMCARFPIVGYAAPSLLHRWQMAWHRQWAAEYSRWRQDNGLAPLAPDEFEWPIAVPPLQPPTSAVA